MWHSTRRSSADRYQNRGRRRTRTVREAPPSMLKSVAVAVRRYGDGHPLTPLGPPRSGVPVRRASNWCCRHHLPDGSEGPPGSAAGLLGGDRVGIFGHELVDVPRRRSSAGGAVLVGEAAAGHGRCPATLGEHSGEVLQQRVVGDTDGPALERYVVAVDGDAEGAARVALDVPDLARPRTAAEVVAAAAPEGTDGGHV